jgi:hypothetical protein
MAFLRFSILAGMLLGCSADYSRLSRAASGDSCASRLVPFHMETAWYNASVEVVGKHISGLLLIKNMPDSTQRVVFTNEAGVTFFDFAFAGEAFTVHSIVSQLDKKAVIKTLRKDFALMLGIPFRSGGYTPFRSADEIYFGVAEKKETAYFITTKDCAYLRRLEWGTPRKRIVSVHLSGSGYPSPDRIEVEHHTFNMQIKLTRIRTE